MSEIRMAPPGKFEGGYLLNERVYEASKNRLDDEAGSVEVGAWYGRLDSLEHVDKTDLNDAEKTFLKEHVGAVIREDDQGFVSVHYFKTREELLDEWAFIEAHISLE